MSESDEKDSFLGSHGEEDRIRSSEGDEEKKLKEPDPPLLFRRMDGIREKGSRAKVRV